MALPDIAEGSKRPSPSITVMGLDGVAVNLTGATITARIRNKATGVSVASDGVFTVTNAVGGIFRWDYGTQDVAVAGQYKVQFVLAYGVPPTPEKTFVEDWVVTEAL